MFMIGSRWAEPDRERVTAGAAGAFKGDPMLSTAPWMVALASALVVLGLPQAAGLATQQPATAAAVRLQLPASPQGAWQRTSETPRWAPSILGADVHAQAVYQDKQAVVGVHVYYYRAQSADRKLVSSVNTLVTTEDPYWHTLGSGSREALVDGERVRFTSTQVLDRAAGITKASRQLTVWKTYWVDDQFTPNDVMAKLLGSVGVLSRRGDDGAALVIYTETSPQQTGDDALAAFVQSQWPALREALRQARAAR
jgi:EpsI family protein